MGPCHREADGLHCGEWIVQAAVGEDEVANASHLVGRDAGQDVKRVVSADIVRVSVRAALTLARARARSPAGRGYGLGHLFELRKQQLPRYDTGGRASRQSYGLRVCVTTS
jgi:hypothetical protein